MPDRPPAAWLVLLDFDGTLTHRDADFLLAEALCPERPGAYRELAEAYERLELSLADYFRGWLALVGQPPAVLAREAAHLPLRPGAAHLVATCRELGLALRVVSEGLDVYVRTILVHHGLGDLDLSCNRLREGPAGPVVLPAEDGEPCARCLNCKGVHVRRAHARGQRVIVVGDGASDLCAARLADRVFARGTLADHCQREGIPYLAWQELAEVAEQLRQS